MNVACRALADPLVGDHGGSFEGKADIDQPRINRDL
jgi:hypothetical protein